MWLFHYYNMLSRVNSMQLLISYAHIVIDNDCAIMKRGTCQKHNLPCYLKACWVSLLCALNMCAFKKAVRYEVIIIPCYSTLIDLGIFRHTIQWVYSIIYMQTKTYLRATSIFLWASNDTRIISLCTFLCVVVADMIMWHFSHRLHGSIKPICTFVKLGTCHLKFSSLQS